MAGEFGWCQLPGKSFNRLLIPSVLGQFQRRYLAPIVGEGMENSGCYSPASLVRSSARKVVMALAYSIKAA